MEESEIIRSFGKVLREIREEKGITQERLANEIQSHFTHISRLENGHKQPTLTTLFKLAEILKVEPEDFIVRMKRG